MSNLGNLFYTLGIKDMTDADLQKIQQKLQNLGVSVDTTKLKQDLSNISLNPIDVKANTNGVKADMDSLFLNKTYTVNALPAVKNLHDAIKTALSQFTNGEIVVKPKKSDLKSAIETELKKQGFAISVNNVNNLSKVINTQLQQGYNVTLTVDVNKLTKSIDNTLAKYNGKNITAEVKERALQQSIQKAISNGNPYKIHLAVDKLQVQDAVRQALQQAGLQSGFTASDKRQYDAESNRIKAEAYAQRQLAMASKYANANNTLAGAHRNAAGAADSHLRMSASLGSRMHANLRVSGELGAALASAYSVVTLKNFLQKVIEIGGELQNQKKAMQSILGDSGIADGVTKKIKELAVKSPFGVIDLTSYTKQLSAYQLPANELYDTMKRMADISAAVGVDMGRIILAYGQVRAAKFLKGTELRQFTEANIPMIDMLSERFTKLNGEMVSAAQIMEMISNKEISFEDVKSVLWELTGSDGKFYNMQEEMSETVKSKWKNVSDAIDIMFADIADELADPLKETANLVNTLISKWELLVPVLTTAVGGFVATRMAALAFNGALFNVSQSSAKAAIAAKKLDADNLVVASTYRKLTGQEKYLIQSKDKLTGAQLAQLRVSGALRKEDILRMIALDKLDAKQITMARSIYGISREEVIAAQKTSVFNLRMQQLGATLKQVGRGMLAFFLNPVTLAITAVSAIVGVISRHNSSLKDMTELADGIFNKAKEGGNNLTELLSNSKDSKDMSDLELTQGIKKLTETIKNYSPTPINDINDALKTQDGHLMSITEKYDALKQKAEEYKSAFDDITNKGLNKSIEQGLRNTSEFWGDDIVKNLKDYDDALSIVNRNITTFIINNKERIKQIVTDAEKESKTFANAVAGMTTYEQKFKELVLNCSRYQKDLKPLTLSDVLDATNGGWKSEVWDNITNFDVRTSGGRLNAAYEEIRKDAVKFADGFKTSLRASGRKLSELTALELRLAILSGVNDMEGSEEAKAIFKQKLEEIFHVSFSDDKVSPMLTERFIEAVESSSNAAIQQAANIWKTGGYEKLDDAQKKLLSDLFKNVLNDSKSKIVELTGSWQEWLKKNPGEWNIVVNMVTQQYDNELPDWTKNAIRARGGVFKGSKDVLRYLTAWGQDGSTYEARNAAQQSLQNAQNELDSYVTAADKLTPGYERAKKKIEIIRKAIAYLGWGDLQTKDQKSNKHGRSGSQKDSIAEKFRQEFKDLKDAWDQYQKWAKSVGKEVALQKVADSGLFPEGYAIPTSEIEFGDRVADLIERLEAAGVKGHNARETLLNELIKEELTIDKSQVDEYFKIALEKIEQEYESVFKNYDLFEKIKESTGNENLAFQLSFGLDTDESLKDYISIVKKQFKDTVKSLNHENVEFDQFKSVEEVRSKYGNDTAKSWENARAKLENYYNKLKEESIAAIEEYQSQEEKIAKIKADATRKKNSIDNNASLSEEQKKKLNQRIENQLQGEILKQSSDYLLFFNSIYALTIDQAEKIGVVIQDNLDKKLKDGAISAKEYSDEINKVHEQINKIRNTKGNFITYLKDGTKGLFEKQLDVANSDVYKFAEKLKAELSDSDRIEIERNLRNAEDKVNQILRILKIMEISDTVASGINKNIQAIAQSFNSIVGVAGSVGIETGMDTTIGKVVTAVEILSTASQNITNAVNSFNDGNDAAGAAALAKTISDAAGAISEARKEWLQKKQDSIQTEISKFSNLQTRIEKMLSRSLLDNKTDLSSIIGDDKELIAINRVNGAYAVQQKLLERERDELIKQKDLIAKDKDGNTAAAQKTIAEIDARINNLNDSITDFSMNLAESLYDINIKDWASQLSDSIISAFANGEDAAEAFNDTVGDIMRSVVGKVIQLNIITPAMNDLQNYLFGENGAMRDNELSKEESIKLSEQLNKLKGQIGLSKEIWDEINTLTSGMLDKSSSSNGSLSSGIQGITENTADLLASYLNSIRAYCANNNIDIKRLIDERLPRMSEIAEAQLAQLNVIVENTRRNALAAESIQQSSQSISDTIRRATQSKENGFYIK